MKHLTLSKLLLACAVLASSQNAHAELYGTQISSSALANLRIGAYSELGNQWQPGVYGSVTSIRFIAEQSSPVSSINWFNIYTGSLKNNVLSACSGYACGDSSLQIKVEIRKEASNGQIPSTASDAVIASTTISNPFTKKFRQDALSQGANLQAGQAYHIVISNLTDQGNCDTSNAKQEDGCNYTSIDHLFKDLESPASQSNNAAKALFWNNSTNSWSVIDYMLPTFQLNYENGKKQGQGYMESWSNNYKNDSFDGLVKIENSANRVVKVRQNFTYSAPTKQIDDLHIKVRKVKGENGVYPKSLKAEIHNASGQLLGYGYRTFSNTEDYYMLKFGIVKYPHDSSNPKKVTLQTGTKYYLTLSKTVNDSTGYDSGFFETYPIRELPSFSTQTFTDGYAEYCVEAGGSCSPTSSSWKGWKRWAQDNRKDGDLQFYFTMK